METEGRSDADAGDGVVSEAVVAEAFRRAQLAGRGYPTVADFPDTVSRRHVEETYFPHIRALQGALNADRVECTPVFAVGYTAHDNGSAEAPPATWGGDAIAALLLKQDALQ